VTSAQFLNFFSLTNFAGRETGGNRMVLGPRSMLNVAEFLSLALKSSYELPKQHMA